MGFRVQGLVFTLNLKPRTLRARHKRKRKHPDTRHPNRCLGGRERGICVYLVGEATPHLRESEVLHRPVDACLNVLEIVGVALGIPRPLGPRDDAPALGPGVFADQPG